MDRAKLVATAFIGIVFSTNSFEPAHAQTPSRFIVQPQKAKQPVAPESAAPARATTPGATSVDNLTSAPVVAQPANQMAFSFKSQIAFPTLGPANSPNPAFESLDYWATAPSIEFEEQVAKLSAQGSEIDDPAEPTVPALACPLLDRPSSGGVQWSSRATGNRSPIAATDFQSKLAQPIQPTSPPTDSRTEQVANEQLMANDQLLTQIADRVGAIESQIFIGDEPAEHNRVRAALVSSQITNDPRFAIKDSEHLSVGRLESPQGWQAIGERLTNHVTRCESLLRRNAFCSAREEGESACLLLIRHIDLIDNLYRCEPAWLAANQSLREAEDFLAVQRMSDRDGLRRLIDSHHTPILKGKNLSEMSPLTAAQHYRVYAEMQLLEASQGHPWASELLYAIGRTYQAEADATPVHVDALRMRSIAFYRASRTTLPSNAVACNQLGYLLLQMDRNEEAREVLAVAVSLKNDLAFLNNFAEASRRLGDSQSTAWAAQNVAAIVSRTPAQPPVPQFIEVTPEEFVAISPHAIGPQPTSENTNRAPAAPTAPAYESATATRSTQTRQGLR